MKILPGRVYAGNLLIEDSFLDFRLFTQGKVNILSRAAIIPLEEYARLLQVAEKYERLAKLKSLDEALMKKEIAIMDDAQIDEKLQGDRDHGTDK